MIPEALRPLIEAAAASVKPDASATWPADIDLVIPTANPAHGHYQWNFALRAAKLARTNPRELAGRLKAALDGARDPRVVRVEIAGPGFLNLWLSDDFLLDQARQAASADAVPRVGAGQTVVVDYSSPNVAKRMHIGHMRSTHIGHAIDRLHRAAGYRVIADNHIGDWGTQFGKLIVAWRLWLDAEAFEADAIGELERLYVLFGTRVAEHPELEDQARAETVKLQQGEPESRALWQRFMEVSLAEFNTVYARMGVVFDEVLGESFYAQRERHGGRDLLEDVVQDVVRQGIAERSEGALIVRFSEPELKDHPAIVQKRDGGYNYTTSDIATVRYRVERWNPARIVYVTDTRQQLHFKQFFRICKMLGVDSDQLLRHAWFGMLNLPEGAMSTRKGNVIRLVDLLDEAARRARAQVDLKSPELPEAERAAIAEAVGVNAIRYADLVQNPQTDVSFAWERILSLEGNTAPYLMYSHARCCQLLAKWARDKRSDEPAEPDLGALSMAEVQERELVLQLARYPEAVLDALRGYRPNILAEYLFELSNRFNRFYNELPVLTSDRRASRVALVEVSRRVLRAGGEVLGLRVLDRM